MPHKDHVERVTEVRPGLSERIARRRRRYLVMMALCLGLFGLAWAVVQHWSRPAAVAMTVVSLVLWPLAAFIANWGRRV